MTVQAIRGVVEAAIQRASQATGVDFGFLLGAARRESGYNPAARASTSSAAGLFQFVEQTWLATLKQHGGKYGYGRYADLISQGGDGRYRVADASARREVMDLRLDPHAASLMAGELASDHASYLRGRMGRAPTSGELYAAHVLGPKGSARLIEASQQTPAASAVALFPEAASANRPIFYRDGRAATVTEVYQTLTRGHGDADAPVPDPTDEQPYLHYASDQRLQKLEQQRQLLALVLRGPERPDSPGGDLTSGLFSADMLRVLAEARGQTPGRG